MEQVFNFLTSNATALEIPTRHILSIVTQRTIASVAFIAAGELLIDKIGAALNNNRSLVVSVSPLLGDELSHDIKHLANTEIQFGEKVVARVTGWSKSGVIAKVLQMELRAMVGSLFSTVASYYTLALLEKQNLIPSISTKLTKLMAIDLGVPEPTELATWYVYDHMRLWSSGIFKFSFFSYLEPTRILFGLRPIWVRFFSIFETLREAEAADLVVLSLVYDVPDFFNTLLVQAKAPVEETITKVVATTTAFVVTKFVQPVVGWVLPSFLGSRWFWFYVSSAIARRQWSKMRRAQAAARRK